MPIDPSAVVWDAPSDKKKESIDPTKVKWDSPDTAPAPAPASPAPPESLSLTAPNADGTMGRGEQFIRGATVGAEKAALGMGQLGNAITGGYAGKLGNWIAKQWAGTEPDVDYTKELQAAEKEGAEVKAARGGEPGIGNLGSWGEFVGENAPLAILPGGAEKGVVEKGLAKIAPKGEGILARTGNYLVNKTAPTAAVGGVYGATNPVEAGQSRAGNIESGAAFGAALHAVGKGISKLTPINSVKKWLSSEYAAGKEAERALAMRSPEDIAAAEKARSTGTPMTYAEESRDPVALTTQREIAASGEKGAVSAQQMLTKQGEGTQAKLDALKGKGSSVGLASTVEGIQTQMENELEAAHAKVENNVTALEGSGGEVPNKILADKAIEAHAAMKKTVNALYDAVKPYGDTPIPVPGLYGMLKQITDHMSSDYVKNNSTLNNLATRAGEDIKGNHEIIPLADFKDFRETVGKLASDMKGSAPGHEFFEIFKKLNAAEDDVLANAPNAPGIPEWRKARAFYRDKYVPTFKQRIGEDLVTTNSKNERKVPVSKVINQFVPTKFGGVPEAAEDFKRIYGDDPEARAALVDAIRAHAFAESQGDSRKLLNWVKGHKPALKAYGVENEFIGHQVAVDAMNDAGKALKTFQKTQLAKKINASPENLGTTLVKDPRALRQAAKIDPEGARAAVGEHLEHLVKASGWGTTKDVHTAATNLAKFKEEVLPVLKDSGLWSIGDLNAYEQIHDEVSRIGQFGVPTAKENWAEKTNWGFLTRAVGWISQRLSGKLGGWMLGAEGVRVYSRAYGERGKEYIRKALADPQFAGELAKYAATIDAALENGVPKQVINKFIDSKKAQFAMWNLYSRGQQNPEEQEPEPREDGGPVVPGKPYLVGERRPELLQNADGSHQTIGTDGPALFIPTQAGMISPRIPAGSAQDYDMQGYVDKYGVPLQKGHTTDEFKYPNHMTFSTGSKYSQEGQEGGKWAYVDKNDMPVKEKTPGGHWNFYPSEYNLKTHTEQELRDYFQKYEEGNKVIFPTKKRKKTYGGD